MTTVAPETPADLERKIDVLSEQVAFLTEELREQRMRRQSWDELRADLAPIADEALALLNRELEEVQDFVRPEDLLRLLRTALRNTSRLEELFGRFESTMDFVDDAGSLTEQAFLKLLTALEAMEQRGYFGFATSGVGVLDRIVTSFTTEDVDQLGDNIVLILNTVKDMTQPEVMRMLQRTARAMDEEVDEVPKLRQLLKQMRDPEVKRGLARLMRVMRSISPTEPDATDHPTDPQT
jgi:uncharacterized protein YjgD (DUF1641 family)